MGTYESIEITKKLPKADRHLHLFLSAPLKTYRDLAKTKIPDLPQDTYGSFAAFDLSIRSHYIPIFSTLENLQIVTRHALEYLIEDGVVYAETSISLTAPKRLGINWATYAAIFRDEISRVKDRLQVRLELGHTREIPFDWKSEMPKAIATGIFSGVDLYGDESHGDISDYLDFFEIARANNLYVKLHTGEHTDAKRMRRDIEIVRPDEIQHGIAAASDTELMALLRDLGTPLNICPTSNVMLGIAPSYSEHPIATLVKHGVIVRLASDDYGLFGVSLSEEYNKLLKTGLLTAEQLEKIRLSGLENQR